MKTLKRNSELQSYINGMVDEIKDNDKEIIKVYLSGAFGEYIQKSIDEEFDGYPAKMRYAIAVHAVLKLEKIVHECINDRLEIVQSGLELTEKY